MAPSSSPDLAAVRAMQMENAAPSAPVMNHLRPSITQPPPSRLGRRQQHAADPSPAPGAGSVMAKPSGTSPAASGARYRSCCSGARDRLEQVHVALVRRRAVERERAEQGVTRLLEDDGLAAQVQPGAAVLGRGLRAEHPRVPGGLLQLGPDGLVALVHDAAELRLDRQHGRADELRGALGQVRHRGRDGEIDGHADLAVR